MIYYETGNINYDEIFATAEREFQRMEAYEEFSSVFDLEPGARIEDGDEGGGIEAWLDDGDGALEDEGATAVIGRAQFFMGAMRDFIGMPASSTIDSKDRLVLIWLYVSSLFLSCVSFLTSPFSFMKRYDQ